MESGPNKRPRLSSMSSRSAAANGSTGNGTSNGTGAGTAGSANGDGADTSWAEKPRKACINCRRQKMKCVPGVGDTCRRCHRAGVPCIFVPRANAAAPILPKEFLASPSAIDGVFKSHVLNRLRTVENLLGLAPQDDPIEPPSSLSNGGGMLDADDPSECPDDPVAAADFAALVPLWDVVAVLRRCAPDSVPAGVWARSTIGLLWDSFHDRMPGLHFMPHRQVFSAPQPVLLASMLYCSALRGPPETVHLAPHYFSVLCNAIAQLIIPGSPAGQPPVGRGAARVEEWAFQTVLGIVLAGLLTEASVQVTGLWISVAYRLIVEHCPPAPADETSHEWRRLFTGVQIVDLEHASLHLTCPVLPVEAPISALQTSPRDQLYRLSRMMHTGLTHFTGRGLPTIWSCFKGDERQQDNSPASSGGGGRSISCSFTAVDGAVIRDWARQLDQWLVEFNSVVGSGTVDADHERKLVMRQYILHRLVVLSIYHPARGFDLWSNSMTPHEQRELLLSARATLKLHLHDDSIWSNWDLVIITWAALIVLQGVEGGAGESDDLRNIRIHLEFLKQRTTEPKPCLCDKLIARLEDRLQIVHTPDAETQQQHQHQQEAPYLGSVDLSWDIFDQSSLQQILYPVWAPGPHEQMPMS